jgi:hypothetical protein
LSRFFLERALICAACVLAPVAAADSDVFDGLGPELVGAELTTVLEGAELACRADSREGAVRRCRPLPGALDSVGGVPVTSVEAVFEDQLLAQVTVYLPESRFPGLKPLLAARLGEGTDWTVIIRSGMAGTFRDEILLWEKDDLVVIAQQFDQRIGRSSLIYGSGKVMAPLLKQIKSTPPGATRDL